MTEQLFLFTPESASPQIDIPKKWERTYKDWSGSFEIVRSRQIGKSKLKNYDIAIDIFDADGDWRTLVEITTPLISSADAEFRDTVDRFNQTNKQIFKTPLTDLGVLPCPSLFDEYPVSESSTEYKPVLNSPVSESTLIGNDSLTPDDSACKNDSLTGVNTYKPAGTARGDSKYFRYSYREGRIKHLHIPGGNTAKPKAQANAQAVRNAIASGKSIAEIKQMIRSMR